MIICETGVDNRPILEQMYNGVPFNLKEVIVNQKIPEDLSVILKHIHDIKYNPKEKEKNDFFVGILFKTLKYFSNPKFGIKSNLKYFYNKIITPEQKAFLETKFYTKFNKLLVESIVSKSLIKYINKTVSLKEENNATILAELSNRTHLSNYFKDLTFTNFYKLLLKNLRVEYDGFKAFCKRHDRPNNNNCYTYFLDMDYINLGINNKSRDIPNSKDILNLSVELLKSFFIGKIILKQNWSKAKPINEIKPNNYRIEKKWSKNNDDAKEILNNHKDAEIMNNNKNLDYLTHTEIFNIIKEIFTNRSLAGTDLSFVAQFFLERNYFSINLNSSFDFNKNFHELFHPYKINIKPDIKFFEFIKAGSDLEFSWQDIKNDQTKPKMELQGNLSFSLGSLIKKYNIDKEFIGSLVDDFKFTIAYYNKEFNFQLEFCFKIQNFNINIAIKRNDNKNFEIIKFEIYTEAENNFYQENKINFNSYKKSEP
jgi:hypothetical protein